MFLYDAYLIIVAVSALAFQIFMFMHSGLELDIRLLIFLILLLQNSNYQVKNDNGSFSINFPLLFPAIIFFGPGWASILGSIGLISSDEFTENSVKAFLYNRGSLGLSAGLSSLVFHYFGGVNELITALFLSVLTYTFTNLGLFLVSRYLIGALEKTLVFVWESFKTTIPSMAIAALFYAAYNYFDVFGVIVVYYVFITIRSGILLGHLETNYRVSLIKSLLRAVYAKDHDLMGHLENVAYYTKLLAKNCGYPRWKLQVLDEASYFHDIGKLEIADEILKKVGKLTDDEYEEMQGHPQKGMKFLNEIPIPSSHKQIVKNIAYYHHERYDGKGYPANLQGDEIPLEARIVAIADTWDAMTANRCYRKKMSYKEAIAELRRVKGTQLDLDLVEVFIKIIELEMTSSEQAFAEAETVSA